MDDNTSINVEAWSDAPIVDSITHYSDVGRNTEISGTVTSGTIYSVIQFTGLPIASSEFFYQIGDDDAAVRMPFGVHTTGGTPENGTCALLNIGTGMVPANQSFLCRYNTRTGDTGTTYQVIVGTGHHGYRRANAGRPIHQQRDAQSDDRHRDLEHQGC